jgi:peroxiredoxin Q/BCP
VQELIREHERLRESGESELAVFQSPAERITRYVGRQAPPFSNIPDPQLKLYRIYGLESSWLGFFRAWTIGFPKVIQAVFGRGFLPGTVEGYFNRIPVDFLIGPNGMLIDVYHGIDIGDHFQSCRILDNLKKVIPLQST